MKRMQLEYFVRIVEEKSFTKAAEKLFISQPALSKSIRALEAELGVTLFKRDPRERFFFQRFCLNTAVNIRRLICRL